MTQIITFDENNQDFKDLQRIYLEWKGHSFILERLINTSTNILNKESYNEYMQEYMESYITYELMKDKITALYITPVVNSKNYNWQADFYKNQIVVEVNE